MTAKKKKPEAESGSHTLTIVDDGTKPSERLVAEFTQQPEVLAACTLARVASGALGNVDLGERIDDLRAQSKAVQAGNLDRAEAMLVAQAHTLDALFAELVRRATLNWNEHLQATDAFLKLALRAQSQSRATWETLAAIKNPPNVAFVKQANIAHGPQQVNNGITAARAGENPNPPNELLGNDHGERLDTGTTGTAGAGDPVMATVGTSDRTAHCRREGDR